jgi:hypothetical protein
LWYTNGKSREMFDIKRRIKAMEQISRSCGKFRV